MTWDRIGLLTGVSEMAGDHHGWHCQGTGEGVVTKLVIVKEDRRCAMIEWPATVCDDSSGWWW